ncbi:hypothetical protein FACS1894151_02940 [Spirochaetia bacterium]|nr:hypothetical protein FACS1894151_02940 [Spirochaetia bacterium]
MPKYKRENVAFFLIFLFSVGISFGAAFNLFFYYQQHIKNAYCDVLERITLMAEKQFPILQEPERLEALLHSDSGEYWEIQRIFTDIQESFGVSYVYVLQKKADGWYFLLSSLYPRGTAADIILEKFVEGDDDADLNRAWDEKVLTLHSFTDRWGQFEIASRPVLKNGEIMCIIGADYDISLVGALYRQARIALAFSIFGSLAVSLLFAVQGRRFIRNLDSMVFSRTQAADAASKVAQAKSAELSGMLEEIRQTNAKIEHLYKIIHESTAKLQLAEPDTFNGTVREFLGELGRSVQVNRLSIWENFIEEGELCCRAIYEWFEGVDLTLETSSSARIFYNDIQDYRSALIRDETISILFQELPPRYQKTLADRGLVSILAIPIFIKGEFWGFLGFGDCTAEREFPADEKRVLHVAATILGSSILRRQLTFRLIDTAESANVAKSRFLATISHELRTPLNAIMGLSEIELYKDMSGSLLPEETRANLEKIHDSGSILLALVNDILDISKIETGKLGLIPGEYSFSSTINDTVYLNAVRIGSKPISFRLDLDETIPEKMIGDELRIKQILNNLLSNAIKFTRAGSVSLSITCRIEENSAILTFKVADTGRGIKREDIGKLFNEYTQLNMLENRGVEGTGLGLAISKYLIELMNGAIGVESEYGKGSTFTVTIRQEIADLVPIGREVAENLMRFRFHDRRGRLQTLQMVAMPDGKVLVVDDVQTNLDVARGLLLHYELVVECVKSGAEAIECVAAAEAMPEKDRYDIIFMDHMMPGMGGVETTRLIRSRESDYARQVPIIALTANALEGNREMFLQNGMNDFLAKPIDLKKLDAILMKWIPSIKQIELKQIEKKQLALKKSPPEETSADERSGETPDVFPAIPGLDTQAGIINTGGDPEQYKAILLVFCTDVGDRIPKITQALEAGDFSTYTGIMHTIKSIARSIGAAAPGDLAAELEAAGRENNRVLAEAKTPLLLEQLSGLNSAIGAALAAADTGIQDSAAEFTAPRLESLKLEALKQALESMDTEAVNDQMKELSAAFSGQDKRFTDTGLFIVELEKYILLFDYEKAVELINNREGEKGAEGKN